MKKRYELIVLTALIFTFTITMANNFRIKIFLDEQSVNVSAPHEIIGNENLSPLIINRGETSIFTWNYDYIQKLTLSGDNSFTSSNLNGTYNLSPIRTSNYHLEVDNGNVKSNKDYTITVIQPDPVITFNSDKYKIGVGESANLSWNVQNSDSASINNSIGNINLNDNVEITPSNDTTYTLNAIGYFGEKNLSRSVFIEVVNNSIINSFTVNKNNFTVGDTAIFNWNVTDSEELELTPYGSISKDATTQNIVLNSIGSFDYTLKSTSFNNSIQSSSPITVNVYGEPLISSYTVNSLKSVNVESGDDLNFEWSQNNGSIIKLDNNIVTGNSSTITAPTNTKVYTLSVENGAGKSINDTVTVNIIQPVTISSFTIPNNVFVNSSFITNWTGNNVEKYELTSINGSGINGIEDLEKSTNKTITPTTAGNYSYTLKATNLAGNSIEQSRNVIVESNPTFTDFTVNGSTNLNVAPGTSLTFTGSGFSSGSSLKARNSANTIDETFPTTAPTNAGVTTYYAVATKTLNNIERLSALRSVSITVIDAPTIGVITAPNNVFDNSAFTMSWTGTNVTNYKIRGNLAASGIPTTDVDLGTATSRSITPTAAGTYIYTITATNSVGVTTTLTRTVIVESSPTFTGFTVNGLSNVSVSPNAALSFIGSGFSSGSTLQGRDSGNTSNATLPSTASSSIGTTTYYAASTKTVNGVTKYSSLRNVSVTVVANPTIGTINAPSNVFTNSTFNMSWSGTGSTNYSIKGNVASSGVSTTDVDLGTTTSRSITPTTAGTYTYTITATNDAGVTTTATRNVIVESDPTFTGFTVNGGSNINVAPNATLTFAGSGFSSGSTLQGRNSSNTANATLPTTAASSAGSNTYYANAIKTLNGVERFSTIRSVVVTVVETWIDTTPTYTSWVDSGSIYSCTNWSPATNTVTNGQSFTQTATDCKQNETRSRQDRETETTTGAIRNKGTPVTETNVKTVSSTQTATGTLIAKECLYGASTYYWKLGGVVGPGMTVVEASKNTSIYWNGATVYSVGGWTGNPVTVSNFKYTRDALKSNTSPANQLYGVCREPI